MNTTEAAVYLVILGAVLAYFRSIPEYLYYFVERSFLVKIEIFDEDESFSWLRVWLAAKLEGTRAVAVTTQPVKEEKPIYYEESVTKSKLKTIFGPSTGVYFFRFKQIFCWVRKTRREATAQNSRPTESYTIYMLTKSMDYAKELIEEAKRIASPEDGKVEVKTCNHGFWANTARIRPRSLNSVILPDNLAKELLKDLETFRKSEKWYTDLGIPWKKGYLLYGPHGNGKSSLVLALASELKMNVCVLSLSSSFMNDSKLLELLGKVDEDSIILIEDIDCAFEFRESGRDRKNKTTDLTFSGLLNALDGIVSQDGRIVFMTTNHPEKLDPALIRRGRVDMKVYIGNAKKEQLSNLFNRFYPSSNLGERFANLIGDEVVNMAAVQSHLISYKNNPFNAVEHYSEIEKC